MKIEKISDTQIRCTLSRKDLLDRELRISELAYGSEKAKALFRDMMQQASYECGFEADDIPLMIEAIPVSSDCLVLVITKVEDPDELDTRFSNFTPYQDKNDDAYEQEEDAYADEIISCFEHIDDLLNEDGSSDTEEDVAEAEAAQSDVVSEIPLSITKDLLKIYSFHSLEEVVRLSKIIAAFYSGKNTLYKSPLNSLYYLVVRISDHTAEDFNKVCNILSEYGKTERVSYASTAFFDEHYDIIVADKAVQILRNM